MQQLYDQLGITDRMTSLVPTMICQVNKVPKLRCSAAQVRAMVPVAIFVGVAGGWLGLWIANLDAPRPISPQASVALSVVGLFFVFLAIRGVRSLVAKVVS